jgi:hypothetical protein
VTKTVYFRLRGAYTLNVEAHRWRQGLDPTFRSKAAGPLVFNYLSISEKTLMKHFVFFLVAFAVIAGLGVFAAAAPGHGDAGTAPYVTEMPHGFRDWQWVSSAHEAGKLNSLGALLANDVAIKAYREGKLPFPDGSILAALHYKNVPSDENNKIFGQVQSFVPGAPTNTQFMVKDSKKYAATGGWGFGHFQDDKPATADFMKPCFPCHAKAKDTDFVFTRYTP